MESQLLTRPASKGAKLSETARHVIMPNGIVSSEFPQYERILNACGVFFDEWQRGFSTLLFAKRSNGKYACGIGGAVLSLPRQVGKTYMIGMDVVMYALMHPHSTIIWTAHHSRTFAETFKGMTTLVEDNPLISKRVKRIYNGNGKESITFINGARILFGARERGFGRGLPAIDIIIYDEAQILSENAIDAIVPTLNASPNGLVVLMGTPPTPKDNGEAFANRRHNAISGLETDTLYIEYSADRTANLDDRDQWKKANPSYPHRTPETSILRLRRQLSDDSFRREALGIWDETAALKHVISGSLWERSSVPARPEGEGITVFALDMTADRKYMSIAACKKYVDGTAHVEHVDTVDVEANGVSSVVGWLAKRWDTCSGIVLDGANLAISITPDLTANHMKPIVLSTRDVAQACAKFVDMLNTGKLTHLDSERQPLLAQAATNAIERPIGKNGQFAWQKPNDDIDISPLVAATNALHGAFITRRNPNRQARILI